MKTSFLKSQTALSISSWLIMVTALGHMIGFLFAVPEHIVDLTWPVHARYHVFQQLVNLIGLDITIMALVLIPYKRQEKWAWWLLLACLLFTQFTAFTSSIVIPGWIDPRPAVNITYAISLMLYITGLILGWFVLSNSKTAD